MAANLVDKTKLQKEISVDIGYELTETIIINEDTGLLFTLSGDVKDNEVIKFADVIPQVSDAASALYLYVLRGRDTSKVFIVDRVTMTDCLNIYSFTGDLNFLSFILKSLFKFWTILSPVLYSSKVPEEVRWEMWFYCPYQVLPDEWLENATFMSAWRERQGNKYVLLNGDETFDFEHITVDKDEEVEAQEGEEPIQYTYINKSTSYSRPSDQTVISTTENKQLQDDKVINIVNSTTYNDSSQGEVVERWGNGTKAVSNTINDMKEGPYMRYTDDRLTAEKWFDDNQTEGLALAYYNSGRIKSKSSYKHHHLDGQFTTYKDADDSPIIRTTEFRDGQMLKSVHYYNDGEYVETNFVSNSTVHSLPLSYDFYTPIGNEWYLSRRITNPISRGEVKTVTNYDVNGNIVDESSKGKSAVFDIMNRKWKHNWYEDVVYL